MSKRHMATLLQVLRARGSIEPLLLRGLELPQIATLMAEARNQGLAVRTATGLEVTEEGMRFLGESQKHPQEGAGGGWIRLMEESKVEPIKETEIFLPDSPPRRHN